MVQGFEDDYQPTPSPESPAFSPFTPIRYKQRIAYTMHVGLTLLAKMSSQ